MEIISTLINWFIPSLIAAIGIMLSSEIIEHNLEFKNAIIIGLTANILPIIITTFFAQIYEWIFYSSIVINLILWITLSIIIMKDIFVVDRLKIGILGFIITQILLFIIPLFLPILNFL